MTGLADDAPGILQAAAQPTITIETEFRAVRKDAQKLAKIDLDALPAFTKWWDELDGVLDGQTITTREHIATVILQTAATGAWLHQAIAQYRPRAVLVASYYGLLGHGSSWACRKLNVPVADVQHGVSGIGHHAYDWPSAPVEGYNTLPTTFLKWSQREVDDMLTGTRHWRPTIVSIGNNWRLLDDVLEKQIAPDVLPEAGRIAAYDALKAAEAQIKEIKRGRGPGKDILVAMHPDEQLPWLADLRKIAPPNWRFWLRLHPGEYRGGAGLEQRRAELSGDNLIVAPATELPLNVLLRHMDAVVTKYSSVALDAHAYGVPSVSYSEAGRFFLGSPERSDVSFVAPVAERIVNALTVRLSPYGSC
ncbi:MAG: hypothetical protein IPL91_01980 [Hyphomicrobium sp.]|nr:hypothetical protein [Hyphomicrobium sp.]